MIGNQFVAFIHWTKFEGFLSVNSSQIDGVLIIPRASPSDSGIYICTATTVSGHKQESQAHVTIINPPTVHIEPDRLTVSQGTSAELHCHAVGDPSPTVRWTKLGEILSNKSLVHGFSVHYKEE